MPTYLNFHWKHTKMPSKLIEIERNSGFKGLKRVVYSSSDVHGCHVKHYVKMEDYCAKQTWKPMTAEMIFN